ncbi:MAG: hypothetical protein AAB862_01085 [Patescibacteria group bacterium]
MINLLPDSQKEIVRAEYRKRLLAASALLVMLSIVIAIVSLFPSYFIARTKYVALKDRADALNVQGKKVDMSKVTLIIQDLNEKLLLLRTEKKNTEVGSIIFKLVENIPPAIKISSITYEKRGETAKMDIAGVAGKREALITFVDRLKKEKLFSEVYSPVSNLVKDTDISFNIQIGIVP